MLEGSGLAWNQSKARDLEAVLPISFSKVQGVGQDV